MQGEYIVRPYQIGEEKYVAEAHERVYLEEYRWGASFGDYAKKVAYDYAAKNDHQREELWVAEIGGKLAGSVMLVETSEPAVGQLRLFLVEKDCRNIGIGSALTKALLEKAEECGYQKLILWIAEPLTAARHHYSKLGFKCTERTANNTWSLDNEIVYEEKWEKLLNH